MSSASTRLPAEKERKVPCVRRRFKNPSLPALQRGLAKGSNLLGSLLLALSPAKKSTTLAPSVITALPR